MALPTKIIATATPSTSYTNAPHCIVEFYTIDPVTGTRTYIEDAVFSVIATNPPQTFSILNDSPGLGYFLGVGNSPAGIYQWQIRFEGQYDAPWMRVYNDNYLPSEWVTVQHTIIQSTVGYQPVWSGVVLAKLNVESGGSNTISGQLKDSEGTVLANTRIDLYVKTPVDPDFMYIGDRYTDASGNFSVGFTVGTVPGSSSVELYYGGDATHVPGYSPVLIYAVAQPLVIPTVISACLPVWTGFPAIQRDVVPPNSQTTIGCRIDAQYCSGANCETTPIDAPLPVDVYVKAPGSSSFVKYTTASIGPPGWSVPYQLLGAGNYTFRYLFSGISGALVSYGPSQCDAELRVRSALQLIWNESLAKISVYQNMSNSVSGTLNDSSNLMKALIADGYAGAVTVFLTPPGGVEQQVPSAGPDANGYYQATLPPADVLGTYTVRLHYSGDYLHPPSDRSLSYLAVEGTVMQPVFMIAYPPPSTLVAIGGNVQLGVGIYVGDAPDCPPTCPPPSVLQPVSGTVDVDVYVQAPGTSSPSLFRTLHLTSGQMPWFGLYSCPLRGIWTVRYEFGGNALYNAHSLTLTWSVGECATDVYEQCSDGTQVLTFTCVNGTKVPTGNVCPTIPTTMQCSAVAELGTGGQVRVGDRLIYQVQVIDDGSVNYRGAVLPVHVGVYVKRPGAADYVHLTDVISGTQAYYLTVTEAGIWSLRFSYAGGVRSGIEYAPSECEVEFQGMDCWDGETRNPYTCPDGTVIQLESCVGGEWGPSGNECVGQTCRQQHPVKVCIGGIYYDCVGEEWVATDEKCVGGGIDLLTLGLIGGALAMGGVGAYLLLRKKA